MKFLPLLVLLVLFQLGASSLMRNWMHDFESRLPVDDYEDPEDFVDLGFHKFPKNMMARSRRGDKMKMCGGKVWKMVTMACGGQCTKEDVNIATSCCETMCTMEEIIGLCCPGR
ncbi:unnamed protein product [Caenorhabditis nigoni]|uniref:Insulin-like domain-containing protein n=2 Tax=Caenorhabditis nigoni TaxID=1611254 RepID=A0A2G5V464_9PELO|nr:hypothetical protein B9Z55_006228 [Caenorhabditis nigoni]